MNPTPPPSNYKANRHYWEALLSWLVARVAAHLREENLRFTFKSRVKTIESLHAKKNGRYRDKQVSDLSGIRFIVPFLDDVESVVAIIRKPYQVAEVERKSEGLSYREFAYDSVHLEIALDAERIILPAECAPCCEIQVRTTLQDAGAEVEHIDAGLAQDDLEHLLTDTSPASNTKASVEAAVLEALTEEALRSFTQSLQIREDQPDVYYLRAQTFVEIQEYTDARKDVERALALNPQYGARRHIQGSASASSCSVSPRGPPPIASTIYCLPPAR